MHDGGLAWLDQNRDNHGSIAVRARADLVLTRRELNGFGGFEKRAAIVGNVLKGLASVCGKNRIVRVPAVIGTTVKVRCGIKS